MVNLFDTYHASKLLGTLNSLKKEWTLTIKVDFSKHGLAALLEMYCDFIPDKRYQLADWRIRYVILQYLFGTLIDINLLDHCQPKCFITPVLTPTSSYMYMTAYATHFWTVVVHHHSSTLPSRGLRKRHYGPINTNTMMPKVDQVPPGGIHWPKSGIKRCPACSYKFSRLCILGGTT